MTSITVSRLEVVDVPNVLHFLKRHYGESYYGAVERFFRWQYLDVPSDWFEEERDSGKIPVNAAVADDGELLAVHVFIPFDAAYKGDILKGCFDEEWINGSTVPGLGRHLASRLINEVDVYCGFGCNDISEDAFKKLGFNFVEEIPRIVAIFDVNTLSSMMKGSAIKSDFEELGSSDFIIEGRKKYCLVTTADLSDEILDTHNNEIEFGILRTRAWLRWRYEKHPYINYVFVICDANPEFGVAVVRIEQVAEMDVRVARIVDLIGTHAKRVNLFEAAMAYACEQGCVLADFFTTSTMIADDIVWGLAERSLMVFREPSAIPYMFQPLAIGNKSSVNFAIHTDLDVKPDMFHAVKSDSTQDIFRPLNSGPQLKRRNVS